MKTRGFTLIEALIALSIAAIIIMASTRLLDTITQAMNNISDHFQRDYRTTLICNQLEKDLSSLSAYKRNDDQSQPDKTENADAKDKDKNAPKEPKESPAQKTSRTLIAYFVDGETITINKKPHQRFRLLNGIITTPFITYNSKKPQLARVLYKLIKQKLSAPHHKKQSFKLYRKETAQLDDLNFAKEATLTEKELTTSQEWVLIAENIYECSFKYLMRNTDQTKVKEQPFTHTFEWPAPSLEAERKTASVPDAIEIILQLWNKDFSSTTDIDLFIPCLGASGTLPMHYLKKKTPKPAAEPEKKPETQPATTPPQSNQAPKPTPPAHPATPGAPQLMPAPGMPTRPGQPTKPHPHSLADLDKLLGNAHMPMHAADLKNIPSPEKILDMVPPEMRKQVEEQAKALAESPEFKELMNGLFK